MSTPVEELPHPHRITVDEYYRMADVGLLAPDARVELIEGEIIDMPPIGSLHGAAVSRLNRELMRAAGERAMLRCQLPIRLSGRSEPEPDFTLVKPRDDDYAQAHPTGPDTVLLIEVSHSTLRYDLQVKVPLYARHGVPEVWIVDLKRRQLHFFRAPRNGTYAEVSVAGEPGRVPLPFRPSETVDFSWLKAL